MTTKHEIEVDLPEGWRAVALRIPRVGEHYLEFCTGIIVKSLENSTNIRLIVQKIKPRQIVLEETGEIRQGVCGEWFYRHGAFTLIPAGETTGLVKIWREVKEE